MSWKNVMSRKRIVPQPPGVTLGPNLWSASWHSQSERGRNRSFQKDKSHPKFERCDNATWKAVVWDASMLFIQLIARDGTIGQFMLDTMIQWYYCYFKKCWSLNLTENVTFFVVLFPVIIIPISLAALGLSNVVPWPMAASLVHPHSHDFDVVRRLNRYGCGASVGRWAQPSGKMITLCE